MSKCTLCPRKCSADREKAVGFCSADNRLKLSKVMLHKWEEPCISGTNGSGAVFFSGCALRCSFCQNYKISQGGEGEYISLSRFEEILFELKSRGAHNINLVTADHYTELIAPVLKKVKRELALPIVFNCSGYETPEMLALLDGVVDVYLPDFKYADHSLARELSGAYDYPDVAENALELMFSQVGKPVIENGIMKRGVLVRHLVLPSYRQNSISVLERLSELFAKDEILLSLMSQYTPNKRENAPDRRLTSFEYSSVKRLAESLGFEGFFQELTSAKEAYTPDFDLEGVTK